VKYIVTVGRTTEGKEFASILSSVLPDNFSITGVHSLGERSDLDKKERFIGFIQGEEIGAMNADFVCSRYQSLGLGARNFDSEEDAFSYAKENYEFGYDDEEKQVRFNKLKEKYPDFTAQEQRTYMIFDSLFKMDRLFPVRGRLNEEPCTVIISISHGKDDVIITPVAIIVDDNIESLLELPFME